MAQNQDWIVPGVAVALYGHGNVVGDRVTLTTVERLTTTQIVLANGRRYRRDNTRREVGGSTYRELLPVSDPQVRRALARTALRELEYRLERTLRAVPDAAGQDDILSVLDSVDRLVAAARAAVTAQVVDREG